MFCLFHSLFVGFFSNLTLVKCPLSSFHNINILKGYAVETGYLSIVDSAEPRKIMCPD